MTFMIYGSTGYTGRMAAEHAAAAGLEPILGGRDAVRLATLAGELGVEHRAFAVDDASAVNGALSDVDVLLNCAGPFTRTAQPLMTGAIRVGSHYLDIAAELDGYQLAETLDEQAIAAGVLLLPGCGGSVAMLGCLASHVVQGVSDPQHIAVALHVAGSMSRGSAVSAAENLTLTCLMRADGVLVDRSPDDTGEFDFGAGPTVCSAVTLPDLVTIWRATEVPNIETFVYVSGDAFPAGDLADLRDGPSDGQRQIDRYHASVRVTAGDGTVVCAMLDTVNGYTFTPLAATAAARRVLGGDHAPGFRTPADLFGSSFAETIADTRIVDTA